MDSRCPISPAEAVRVRCSIPSTLGFFFRVRATHGDEVRAGNDKVILSVTQTYHKYLDVPLARPHIKDTDVAGVVAVLNSGQLCQGEMIRRFEEHLADLLGVSSAVCVSSGSAALLVAMQAFGIQAGDEVIVPDITFATTATAAVYLGATPVFCDISLTNYCMDPLQLESLISDRTKLIVPVHLGGRVADVDAIQAIAQRHSIPLLEDAAGALGSTLATKRAGAMGDAAIFSFTPTKLITTGEGGAITTNDGDFAERCRLIRNFGDHGKFDWQTLGFNFRMTEMSAALGLEQLHRLDAIIEQRKRFARRYNEAFADVSHIITPRLTAGESTNFQLYTVRLQVSELSINRDDVIARLAERGIAARLYYPALHRMKMFNANGVRENTNAKLYEQTAISLPMFADMTDTQQKHVIDTLCEIVSDAAVEEGGAT